MYRFVVVFLLAHGCLLASDAVDEAAATYEKAVKDAKLEHDIKVEAATDAYTASLKKIMMDAAGKGDLKLSEKALVQMKEMNKGTVETNVGIVAIDQQAAIEPVQEKETFTKPFIVKPTANWEDAGFSVPNNATLHIIADGQVSLRQTDPKEFPLRNADGLDKPLIIEGIQTKFGRLLMKVGERVYEAGKDKVITIQSGGKVHFMVAEVGDVGNNSGQFTVKVGLRQNSGGLREPEVKTISITSKTEWDKLVGQKFEVKSKILNDTNLDLTADMLCYVVPDPEGTWRSSPDHEPIGYKGYSELPLNSHFEPNGINFLAMCSRIGGDKSTLAAITEKPVTATGRLYLLANDSNYPNNIGSIWVKLIVVKK